MGTKLHLEWNWSWEEEETHFQKLPFADELDNDTSDKLMINVLEWRGC